MTNKYHIELESATDDEIAEYYNRNSVSVNVAKASAQTARMRPSVKQSVKPNISWNTATSQQIEAYEEWMSENSDNVKAKPKSKPKAKPKPKPKAKKPKEPKITPKEQRLQTIIPVASKSPLKKAGLNLRGYIINNEDIIPSVFIPIKAAEEEVSTTSRITSGSMDCRIVANSSMAILCFH
jgi:hypothetical protein